MMKTLPGIEKKVVHILHTNQFSPHFCYNFFSWTLKWKCLLPNHEVTNSLSLSSNKNRVHRYIYIIPFLFVRIKVLHGIVTRGVESSIFHLAKFLKYTSASTLQWKSKREIAIFEFRNVGNWFDLLQHKRRYSTLIQPKYCNVMYSNSIRIHFIQHITYNSLKISFILNSLSRFLFSLNHIIAKILSMLISNRYEFHGILSMARK